MSRKRVTNNNTPEMDDVTGEDTHGGNKNGGKDAIFEEDDPEEVLQQLNADIKRLDEQEKDAKICTRYEQNRVIFLMQSTLLGISYSIIWPTLWLYIKEFELDVRVEMLLYGVTFVAYPLASILSAHIVERTTLPSKVVILLLCLAEVVGNVVFSLRYHVSLLVVGRFVAGLGDAFYVILMRDMKSKHSLTKNESMTMECLAAFILGVILSPGINILTSLIPFKLLTWSVNSNNYPGVSASVLFLLMVFIVLIFLHPEDREDSSPSSPSRESSNESSNGNGYFVGVSACKPTFIAFYSFVYTYIVSYFEITIPLLIYEKLKFGPISAMLLYAVLGTLYAMILMLGMTMNLRKQLEASVGITVIAKTVGLFSILYIGYRQKDLDDILCVGAVVVALAILWSNDDILFINLARIILPVHVREYTHNVRKNVSKAAFAMAAVTVPFVFNPEVYVIVVPILVILVFTCFVLFVVIRCHEHKTTYKYLK